MDSSRLAHRDIPCYAVGCFRFTWRLDWMSRRETDNIPSKQHNPRFGDAGRCELRFIVHIRMVNSPTMGTTDGQGAIDVLPGECDVLDCSTDGRLFALVVHTEHPC